MSLADHPEAVDAPRDAARARSAGRACIVAAALLWSLSGVITKSLELGPMPIAFYRSFFAGLVLLPFVPRSRWQFRPGLVPLGLIFGAMIGVYIASVKATTAANAIYLQYTATFWVVPLGIWLLGERPDPRALAGIALAMVGIGIIVARGYDGRPGEVAGIAFGLASAVGYAAVAVLIRRLRALDPLWLSAVANLGGALALGAWLMLVSGSIPLPGLRPLLVLLAFGTIQMAIPYALFSRGLRTVSAAEAGLLALIEPLVNPLWVAWFHGEVPAPATLVGGAFLLAGLVMRYVLPAREGA